MGIFDKLQTQEDKKNQDSFAADMDDKLDEKAFRRACKTSQGSSALVNLGNDRQIDKALKDLRQFDYRVIAMINKWSHSEHPEREVERVIIDGKPASDYMKETGYSFMDCMVLAQNAVMKNKPGVEFKMEVTGKQERHDRKMNLSDPNLKYNPPSHMPKALSGILKIASFGFFQNREERINHKKELEMIRLAAVERERQSRLDKADKSAYAEDVRRKKAQNRVEAEKGKKLQEEYELSQRDERHGKESLEKMEISEKKLSSKLLQLGERREKLAQKAAESQRKMTELEGAKDSVDKWIKENPNWKADEDKRKAFAGMMKKVNAYDEAHREYEQTGRDMAKIHRTADKVMKALGELEGKRPRLTELYQKQTQHLLTEEDRKELAALEKPGSVMEGHGQVTKDRAARADMAMSRAARTAGRTAKPEASAAKQVQENARQSQKAAEKSQGERKQAQEAVRKAEDAGRKADKRGGEADTGRGEPASESGRVREKAC